MVTLREEILQRFLKSKSLYPFVGSLGNKFFICCQMIHSAAIEPELLEIWFLASEELQRASLPSAISEKARGHNCIWPEFN